MNGSSRAQIGSWAPGTSSTTSVRRSAAKDWPEDGHPPEQVAVGGAQAIDVGDDDALDRVGQGADGVPVQHRRNELPHEERVAPGTVDEELDLSTGQRRLPGRRQGELGGLRLTQRERVR